MSKPKKLSPTDLELIERRAYWHELTLAVFAIGGGTLDLSIGDAIDRLPPKYVDRLLDIGVGWLTSGFDESPPFIRKKAAKKPEKARKQARPKKQTKPKPKKPKTGGPKELHPNFPSETPANIERQARAKRTHDELVVALLDELRAVDGIGITDTQLRTKLKVSGKKLRELLQEQVGAGTVEKAGPHYIIGRAA